MTTEKVTVEFTVWPMRAFILREVAEHMDKYHMHGIKFLKKGLIVKISDEEDPFGSDARPMKGRRRAEREDRRQRAED